jgi:hypothetical protein
MKERELLDLIDMCAGFYTKDIIEMLESIARADSSDPKKFNLDEIDDRMRAIKQSYRDHEDDEQSLEPSFRLFETGE